MRAIFTAGVLDAMAERGDTAYDLVIGVSAGAYCATSFLSGQHGRIQKIVERYMSTSRYVSPARMLVGGSLIDQDYLIDTVTKVLLPLDEKAFRASSPEFEVVTTHAHTGEPCYLPGKDEDWLSALHATVAMPFFYRGGPIEFRKELHFDGSITEPVPLARAIARGATDITVVLNRPVSWEPEPLGALARLALRVELADYPGTYAALLRTPLAYRAARLHLDGPPPGVRLRVIRPPSSYAVTRFTRDTRLLEQGYRQGFEVADL